MPILSITNQKPTIQVLEDLAREIASGLARDATITQVITDGQLAALTPLLDELKLNGTFDWSSGSGGGGITPVPDNRLISTVAPLAGGGTLASDLTLSLLDNGITDAKLRDSVGTSVIGRSSGTTGNPADIVAGSDGDVLRREAGVLGFGLIPQSSVINLVTDLSGKIDEVIAGTNLSGGGTSGAVTLDVVDNPTFAGNVGIGVSATHPLEIKQGPAGDLIRLWNTNASGTSAIGLYDTAGTGQGFFGYGQSSTIDTTVRNRNYWRTKTADFVISRGTNASSVPALFIAAATGNVNIGSTAADPGTKLRVQGNTLVTGTLAVDGKVTLGDAISDSHIINGNTAILGSATSPQLSLSSPGQAIIRVVGDNDNSGNPGFTGFVISKGSSATEQWYIGRNGPADNDGLIFRRSGANHLTLDPSGHASFANNVEVLGNLIAGNASTDTHSLTGTLNLNGTTGSDGHVVQLVGGLPKWSDITVADVSGLQTALDGKIDEVIAGTNLSGGGSSGSVTLNVVDSPSFAGNVTLGDASTDSHLANGTVTVRKTATGLSVNADTIVRLDNTGDQWLSFSGSARKGILFANASGTGDGAIIYDHGALPRGLMFNAGGLSHLWISSAGNITLNPNGGGTTASGTLSVAGAATFSSSLTVNGNATLGNEGTDAHSLRGTLSLNSTAGSNGQVAQIVGGLPVWSDITVAEVTGLQTALDEKLSVSQQAVTALTDSAGGTADDILEALPDPADTPADADALRDDLVTNLIPALRNNLADLAAKINEIRAVLVTLGLVV